MSLLRAFMAPLGALALTTAPAVVQAQQDGQTFRFAVPTSGEIEAAVWLPDVAAFAGPRPLIVISHGNGGHVHGHHDTAEALAEAGLWSPPSPIPATTGATTVVRPSCRVGRVTSAC